MRLLEEISEEPRDRDKRSESRDLEIVGRAAAMQETQTLLRELRDECVLHFFV